MNYYFQNDSFKIDVLNQDDGLVFLEKSPKITINNG